MSDSQFSSVGNKANHAVDAEGDLILRRTELFYKALSNTEPPDKEPSNTEHSNTEHSNKEHSNKPAAFRNPTWHYY